MSYPFKNADECPGFKPCSNNGSICQRCGAHVGNHNKVHIDPTKVDPEIVELIKIRDSFIAQLPIVAAIIYMGNEESDFRQAAVDALELVRAIEEELGG